MQLIWHAIKDHDRQTHMWIAIEKRAIHIYIAIYETYLEISQETLKGIEEIQTDKTGKLVELNKNSGESKENGKIKMNILNGSSVCT